MRINILSAATFLLVASGISWAQSAAMPYTSQVADAAVLAELQKIARSVQSLTEGIKAISERPEPTGGSAKGGSLSEKQQKLVLSMDMLVKSEERVANFQRLQIDLVEKLNENRGKLAQVDIDLRPQAIDRSLAFEGTTQTDELRDNKRAKLRVERTTLLTLISQIQSTLNDTQESLSDALAQTFRLRRAVLPQLDRELIDQ
jgi:hypothetical protein